MRITTRGQLAVSAMTDLAMRQNTGPVALSTISARQGISLSYLEQLFSALKRAGLVDSTRGPGGGYALARKPDQVSVADIVVAVENHQPGGEAAATQASSQMVTMTGTLWTAFNARVLEYLQSVTLRDLVAEQQARGVQVESPVVARAKLARRPAPLMARAGVPNSVFALGAATALAGK
ncbi:MULTISPECIES: Rrf2 family transcriptional regulator [Acidovorax]|uniref:Rrf2 family transcriptional regulator, iron-sulfur cluster assembly transcription factor n=1 Tax=Acidovorax soli TaxID=592050 RepID=A0A1H4AU94_9BURK|nr:MULTISPECIES: Rrf2 family transcriptional regulator [Acidovorax]SEA39212.1 Rrf2 family transcriptional regulator, iron-sulfur cluster assembly transcription factor [Acidovorax soli]